MLDGSLTYVIVIIWGVWVLRGDRLGRESQAKALVSLVLAFYLSRLIAATFFPFPIDAAVIDQNRAIADAGFGPGNNFVPFATVLDAARSTPTFVSQIIGNFLLLFPLGFLMPLLSQRFAKKANAIGLVVMTTLSIELLQLAISGLLGYSYRSFDVDDLWLNALGGISGVIGAAAAFGNASWLHPSTPAVTESDSAAVKGSREIVPYRSARG